MSPAHNYRIIRLKEVDSTNAWAKSAYAEKIVSSNAAIVAATQHAGRGQMRTKWHDESGKNILLTLVVDVQNLRAVDFFRLKEERLFVRHVRIFSKAPVALDASPLRVPL